MLILLESAECRGRVPIQSAFLQEELRQRRTCENHLHRASAVVVFAVVADGEHALLYSYANDILAAFAQQGDIRDNAHRIAYLVGDVFHQLVGIFHADRLLSTVLDAEVDYAALCIGIAAYPGKILVVPAFLVFDILRFVTFHRNSSFQIIANRGDKAASSGSRSSVTM